MSRGKADTDKKGQMAMSGLHSDLGQIRVSEKLMHGGLGSGPNCALTRRHWHGHLTLLTGTSSQLDYPPDALLWYPSLHRLSPARFPHPQSRTRPINPSRTYRQPIFDPLRPYHFRLWTRIILQRGTSDTDPTTLYSFGISLTSCHASQPRARAEMVRF